MMVKRVTNPPRQLRVVIASDVDTILSSLDPESALENQAQIFRSYSASSASSTASPSASHATAVQDVQTPHRTTVSSPEQTMLFMPARAGGAGGTAAKIVSIPNAGGEGLPATTVVMDEATGMVKGLVNARKLTALRNACGSALSLRAVPPSQPPQNLLLFGSGAQIHSHASMFLRLYPSIRKSTVIVRRPTPRSASLLIELGHQFPQTEFKIGVSSYPIDSASTANPQLALDLSHTVEEADIIVTATSSNEPLFSGADVKSGAHVVMIGSYKPHMHEVDEVLVKRAGLVIVDSKEACAREAGELIDAGIGPDNMVELGDLLGGNEKSQALVARVRQSGDVIMFKSVGIGIQDVAIAHLILAEAERTGLGTVIPNYDE